MSLELYISSVSGNAEIRSKQTQIQNILDSLKIKHEVFDIAACEKAKSKMRAGMEARNKSPYIPPQLFIGDEYLGDFSDFNYANENETLYQFLRLPTPKKNAE